MRLQFIFNDASPTISVIILYYKLLIIEKMKLLHSAGEQATNTLSYKIDLFRWKQKWYPPQKKHYSSKLLN